MTAGPKIVSLGFHDISQSGRAPLVSAEAARYTITPGLFRKQLESVRAAVSGSAPLFTFDDGAESGHTLVAGLLEQFGWRGYFFVVTGWIGRAGFLTAGQIRDLHQRGHVVGSHTCTHPERMSSLSSAQLRREWSESRAILEDVVNARVACASVANGYYSRRVAEAASASGLQVLFTSQPTMRVRQVGDCLVRGRYSIQGDTEPAVCAAISAARMWPRYRQWLAWESKGVLKGLGGDAYLGMRRWWLARSASAEGSVHP